MSRHNRRMGPLNPFAAQAGLPNGVNLALPSAAQQQLAAQEQRIQGILHRRDNLMAACIAAAFAHPGNYDTYDSLIADAKVVAEKTCVAQQLVESTEFFRKIEADTLAYHNELKAAQAEQNTVITPDSDAAE